MAGFYAAIPGPPRASTWPVIAPPFSAVADRGRWPQQIAFPQVAGVVPKAAATCGDRRRRGPGWCQQSTGARRVTPAMPPVSGSVRASRRTAAGSSPSPACARPGLRGLARVNLAFTLAAAAYNLVRLPKLIAVP